MEVTLDIQEKLIPLRDFCRNREWPRLSQWNHWIYSRSPIALACVKRIGGRYMIDLEEFQRYIKDASLDEKSK